MLHCPIHAAAPADHAQTFRNAHVTPDMILPGTTRLTLINCTGVDALAQAPQAVCITTLRLLHCADFGGAPWPHVSDLEANQCGTDAVEACHAWPGIAGHPATLH